MLVNLRNRSPDKPVRADVCIVGAGPAGLTMARQLAGTGIDVLLLESGDLDNGVSAQDLNEGSVEGDAYAGLRETRHRGGGGTVRLWNTPVRGEPGAKYAPLDVTDFLPRGDAPLAGWPFDRATLVPYYVRAHRLCALGSFEYDVSGKRADATDSSASGDVRTGPPIAGDNLVARVYRFGSGRVFTGDTRELTLAPNLGAAMAADNVRLCPATTVVALRVNGRRVVGLDASEPGGRILRIDAGSVVLAAGAVENARLLLAAGDAPWSENEWLGRCFMEHPRDYSMVLVPSGDDWPARFAFFDTHEAQDGTLVAGRIAISSNAILEHRLPNASVTLLPRLRATLQGAATHGRALGRVLDALRRRGHSRATEGYGWSRTDSPASIYDALRLIVNVEQAPHADNRITLGARDRLGVPRVVLHWRWRETDEAALDRLRVLIAHDIRQAGLGEIRRNVDSRIDPNAHHHAGTTRMHADPRWGVTDADGRVHGTDNLFVAGASLFPTAGFANPMLTIVALSVRLADRLATMHSTPA